MAQAVLTIAGQMVGGPIGAMVGSAIGGMLFPEELPDVHGPRLSDLKVTVSTYGQMIPIVWGKARIAGNVIWSTERIETTNKQEQGKGGGPVQTTYTYSYSQSFAIAICEGEVVDIIKIYANGKCIYNTDSNADIYSAIRSQGIANNIRIYKGTSDQLPDPLIESLAGIENTSAYRGTCYIVFDNFQLANYGNNLPNLEFEVVKVGANIRTETQLNLINENIFITTLDPLNQYGWRVDYINKTFTYCFISPQGEVTPIQTYTSINTDGNILIQSNAKTDDNSLVFCIEKQIDSTYASWFYTISKDGAIKNIDQLINNNNNYNSSSTRLNVVEYRKINNKLLIAINATNSSYNVYNLYLIDLITNVVVSKYFSLPTNKIEFTYDAIYIMDVGYVSKIATVNKYDYNLNLVKTIYTETLPGDFNWSNFVATDDNNIYFISYQAYQQRKIWNVSSGQRVEIFSVYYNTNGVSEGVLYYQSSNFFNILNYGGKTYSYTNIKSVSTDKVSVGTIVNDLCLKSGLPLNMVDTSQLVDLLYGYVVAKRTTLRSAIEPLQQAFFFDGVDSDGKIKFVKRGGSVAAVIQPEELAVRSYGADLPDNIVRERKQDIELPMEVTASYFDINGAYQISTQYARRQNTKSVNKISMELPIVITGNDAKAITETILSEYWQSRDSIKLSVGIKYLFLEPSDIIQTWKDGNLLTLKIIDIEESNGVLNLTCTTEDVTKYTQEFVGASLSPRNEVVDAITPTNIQFLDIPLLRDSDDKQGLYIASNGYMTGWPGGVLMRSIDNGVTFNEITRLRNGSSIGYTNSVLGNFTSGNIIDELNTIIVSINTTLSSIDLLTLLNGGNIALVGDEIIQFRNASLNSDGTYTLSGFIRGKQGTEQYISTHVNGERFIILNDTTIGLLNLPSSEYDLERKYKAVTFGQTEYDATSKSFTFKGVAQECYSPVHLGGGRDADGNLILNWIRRSRINNTWNNKIDVPLGEDTEAYEVDIINQSTGAVVRTLTSNTPTVTYTAAQQVADFGSNQSSVKFTVYQLSTLRGRGFPATNTI